MAEIGPEEKEAVLRVLDSGCLSGYLAGDLHGGPEVEALEQEWAAHFGYKHAIAVNSATSGLIIACWFASLRGGLWDFIVSPLTMSATATACFNPGRGVWFGDIEPDYLCLSAKSVEKRLTTNTAAIVVTDLFGQAYDPEINHIALQKGALVIEDAAQRPMPGQGDIVVYSLNYHKHIHCGEGGIVCTNNDAIALNLRWMRNHGECGGSLRYGFNFRLTEIQAAIARVQLKKLPDVLKKYQENVPALPGLAPVRPGFEHAWYLYPFLHDAPNEAFEYKSFLPDLPFYKHTKGEYPTATEVIKHLKVVRP